MMTTGNVFCNEEPLGFLQEPCKKALEMKSTSAAKPFLIEPKSAAGTLFGNSSVVGTVNTNSFTLSFGSGTLAETSVRPSTDPAVQGKLRLTKLIRKALVEKSNVKLPNVAS
jgi:hypothetical protein